MAADSNNILIGAATVYISGTDVGYTKGGVKIIFNPTYVDVKADQAVGTIKKARADETIRVMVPMLEPTLNRVRIAFDQPASNLSGSTLLLGYNNSCLVNQHQLILTGVGPSCTPRMWVFQRCVSIGNVEYTMQRDQETVLNVEFECLKLSSGQFGYVNDNVANLVSAVAATANSDEYQPGG
jgi:hypothetical protein